MKKSARGFQMIQLLAASEKKPIEQTESASAFASVTDSYNDHSQNYQVSTSNGCVVTHNNYGNNSQYFMRAANVLNSDEDFDSDAYLQILDKDYYVPPITQPAQILISSVDSGSNFIQNSHILPELLTSHLNSALQNENYLDSDFNPNSYHIQSESGFAADSNNVGSRNNQASTSSGFTGDKYYGSNPHHIARTSNSHNSDKDFDSDDSVLDKDYDIPRNTRSAPIFGSETDCDSIIPNSQPHIVPRKTRPTPIFGSETDCDSIIPNSQPHIVPRNTHPTPIFGSETDCDSIIPDSQPHIIIPDSQPEQNTLTKRGTIRKRKIFETNIEERKKIRRDEKILKEYALKTGCDENCKKKCSLMIHEERRNTINTRFWSLTWSEQKLYVANHTSWVEPVRKKNFVANPNKKNRTKSLSYYLSNETGERIPVCKVFFLTTLGFTKTNDKAVRYALNNYDAQIIDRRGYNKKVTINRDVIRIHIETFKPSISHYRREHAPNRRYLSSELTIKFMYEDYNEKYPTHTPISYEVYRKEIKKMNISFAKLGHEECEICEQFQIHNPNSNELRHRNCDICKNFDKHHERYILARQTYDIDRETAKSGTAADVGYFSVDLQKVIMLPRIDMFKLVLFCPRLVAFNESFVPLGYKTSDTMTFAAIWHEAISGRKKDDIICAFKAFLEHFRDFKKVTLWLDNCAAQNKNWALFSFLISFINSNETTINTIVLKYFETGHTFMSADEFHHQVEHAMKKKKKIYDFNDFADAVASTNNRKTIVKQMVVTDFFNIADDTSNVKIKKSNPRAYLRDMSEICFKKGSSSMYYKNYFNSPDYIELECLKKTIEKKGFSAHVQRTEPRGITSERKNNILQKLGPLMPANRKLFWENLHTNNAAANLLVDYED